VGGTFTVVDFYSTKLAWIFPLEKPDQKTRLINLAMGLCGAINFRVEIGPNLSNIQAGKSNQEGYFLCNNQMLEIHELIY